MSEIDYLNNFKRARQLLMITEVELGNKVENIEIAVVGSGEASEVLISVLKGAGAIVLNGTELINKTFDTVILFDAVDEEKLIGMLNKNAIIIDAAEHISDETEYYMPKYYRKIRVISLQKS